MTEKEWQRTNEFRFVSKVFFVQMGKTNQYDIIKPQEKMILQQRFEMKDDKRMTLSEWRDVPVVSE